MSEQKIFNGLADELFSEERKKNEDIQNSADEDLIQQLKYLLSPPHNEAFNAVAWRILEQGAIFRTAYTGNTKLTDYLEGQRDMALWFLDKLIRARGSYVLYTLVKSREKIKELQNG